MDSYKRERIDRLIEVLSEIPGTREDVYETMALVLLDQHEITVREYEEIMENISRYSKEKEKERMGVIQS
jgi:recombinational DNA repair protein RecR